MNEAQCLNYFTQIVLAFKEVHDMPAFHKNVAPDHILAYVNPANEDEVVLKLTGFSKLRSMNHECSVDSVSAIASSFFPPDIMSGGDYDR